MIAIFWVLLVILVIGLSAIFAKKVLKLDLYLGVLIMWRTKRLIKYLDVLARPKKFLEIITDIGLVIGFGAFGLDYVIRDKVKKLYQRFLIFVGSGIIISLITYLLTQKMLFSSALIPEWFAIIIVILTGVMGLSGFTLGSLIFSAYDIIAKMFIGQGGNACPGVGLVIPGVQMPKVDIFIPWYGWIILIVAAIVHEVSHGILLRKMKVKLKSMGFMFASLLPLGAFVEPDEKAIEKKNKRDIARMYSAGPMSNVILAIIFLVLFLAFTPVMTNYSHSIGANRVDSVYVYSIDKNTQVCGSVFDSPAYGVLDVNDIIVSVNNKEIMSSSDLSKVVKLKEDNNFVVKNQVTGQTREVVLKPNEMGKLGFSVGVIDDPNLKVPFKYYLYRSIFGILLWSALLNFIIATVNYLPSFPFDGGGMSQIIFSDYLDKKHDEKKRMKKVAKFFGAIIVILLILNIIPYFL